MANNIEIVVVNKLADAVDRHMANLSKKQRLAIIKSLCQLKLGFEVDETISSQMTRS